MTVAPEGRRLLRVEARNAETPIARKPEWIRVRAPGSPIWAETPPSTVGDAQPRSGTASAALWGFLMFYVSCAVLTWFAYSGPRGILHLLERTTVARSPSTVPA